MMHVGRGDSSTAFLRRRERTGRHLVGEDMVSAISQLLLYSARALGVQSCSVH